MPAVSIHVIAMIVKTPRACLHVDCIYIPLSARKPILGMGWIVARCGLRSSFVTLPPDHGAHAELDVGFGLCGRTYAR